MSANPYAPPVDDGPPHAARSGEAVELALHGRGEQSGTYRVRLGADRITVTAPDDTSRDLEPATLGRLLAGHPLGTSVRVLLESGTVLDLSPSDQDALRRYAGSQLPRWAAEATRRIDRLSLGLSVGLVAIAVMTGTWLIAPFGVPGIAEAAAKRLAPGRYLIIAPVVLALVFAGAGAAVVFWSGAPWWWAGFLLLYFRGAPAAIRLHRFFAPATCR